ncbi:hypothetical protein FRB98_004496 [Tulasnella sp. 332]|nr:hypothetical protein FRB98_004496 [Tulasnella sp. 332]
MAQGRYRDQEWMVDYAESCLGGPAIRWYSELDDDVTLTWKRLRQALLDRFGPLDDKYIPQAAPATTAPKRESSYGTSQTVSSLPITAPVNAISAYVVRQFCCAGTLKKITIKAMFSDIDDRE